MEQEKIIELDETNVCKICTNALSKYTCPKCNIYYCSLNCYQSQTHLKCSEEFYRESVMTELCSGDQDEAAKQKMLEILEKVRPKLPNAYTNEEMDSDDGEPIPALCERLENVDLNDANKVWEHLTTDEKQEFEALVNSGDVTSIIPLWTPWWEKVEKKMVEEVATSTQSDYKKICPEVMENIKPFEHISTLKPAECVKYNVLNVIVAYACTVRYFNGFHFDFANEAVYVLTKLSLNLLSNTNFESYSVALESVYQETLVNDWMSASAKDTICEDAETMLEGPECQNKSFFIKAALSDIYKLLSYAKELLSNTDNTRSEFYKKYIDTGLPKEKIVSKEKCIAYRRKIQYYLSYVCSFVFDI